MVHPPGKKHPDGRKVSQVYRKPKGGTAAVRVDVCAHGELPTTALKGQALGPHDRLPCADSRFGNDGESAEFS